jgi:septal ring factor EnvC (AmiA/AmiB activator)
MSFSSPFLLAAVVLTVVFIGPSYAQTRSKTPQKHPNQLNQTLSATVATINALRDDLGKAHEQLNNLQKQLEQTTERFKTDEALIQNLESRHEVTSDAAHPVVPGSSTYRGGGPNLKRGWVSSFRVP